LDCRHVCKTCAFHDVLQAWKQKEVHLTPLIWRLQAPDQGSTVVSSDVVRMRTTSLNTTRPSTMFYRLLLN
jgi:hypothetical protein